MLTALLKAGLSEAELETIVKTNPARLLDLEVEGSDLCFSPIRPTAESATRYSHIQDWFQPRNKLNR